jgi:hypothetical protein
MPPLGTCVSYWLHLSLYSHCIEDWAFSQKSIFFIAIIFSVLFPLDDYTPKTQKQFYLLFPIKLANQYLHLLVGSQPFLYWKVLQLIFSTWESSGVRLRLLCGADQGSSTAARRAGGWRRLRGQGSPTATSVRAGMGVMRWRAEREAGHGCAGRVVRQRLHRQERAAAGAGEGGRAGAEEGGGLSTGVGKGSSGSIHLGEGKIK